MNEHFIGTTYGRMGSVYLDLITILDGIHKGSIKITTWETKFGIQTTKKYSMILSKKDLAQHINTKKNTSGMFPTEDNDFIHVNSMNLKFKGMKMNSFHANFYKNKNFMFGWFTKNININGYNLVNRKN
jgi:hypothetical protein